MNSEESLNELARKIKYCRGCDLWKSRKNAVPGDGHFDTKLMFVGEAPGREEDKQGLPFVGKSGQLFSELLNSVGIDRNKVFITSAIKCRPPQNRNPSSNEVDSCSSYLFEQIEAISPRVICVLGNIAARVLLGKSGITKIRGKVVEKGGIVYLPTYHPAAAARNPRLKIVLKKDLEKLAGLLAEQ